MFTIAPPPRSRITAAAAFVHRNVDSRLSRNIARHSSSEISASGWSGKFCPALLTRMSTGPSRSSASAKNCVTSPSLSRSAWIATAVPPARLMAPTTSLAACRSAPVVHDHACPGLGEPFRDPGPDPLRRPGHDRDATGQVEKVLRIRDVGCHRLEVCVSDRTHSRSHRALTAPCQRVEYRAARRSSQGDRRKGGGSSGGKSASRARGLVRAAGRGMRRPGRLDGTIRDFDGTICDFDHTIRRRSFGGSGTNTVSLVRACQRPSHGRHR